jgi:hypothetical protein
MGVKDLKNRKLTSFAIDNELLDFLREYSKISKIPQSRIIDIAIKLFKEKVEKDEKIF